MGKVIRITVFVEIVGQFYELFKSVPAFLKIFYVEAVGGFLEVLKVG